MSISFNFRTWSGYILHIRKRLGKYIIGVAFSTCYVASSLFACTQGCRALAQIATPIIALEWHGSLNFVQQMRLGTHMATDSFESSEIAHVCPPSPGQVQAVEANEINGCTATVTLNCAFCTSFGCVMAHLVSVVLRITPKAKISRSTRSNSRNVRDYSEGPPVLKASIRLGCIFLKKMFTFVLADPPYIRIRSPSRCVLI